MEPFTKFFMNFIDDNKLSTFATLFFAISKAGPWSGETLKIGRPPVTFIELRKSKIFIGISAWSW